MRKLLFPAAIVALALVFSACETLDIPLPGATRAASSEEKPQPELGGRTRSTVAAGLRQALSVAVDRSAGDLGRAGGYLSNPSVRIPLPENLEKARTVLASLGQGQYADEFVTSMNRAAEAAAPEVADVLVQAVREMTLEDVARVYNGPDDAATQYFESTCRTLLTERLLPPVGETLDRMAVTRAYRTMVQRAEVLAPFLGGLELDLDRYVVDKALDGFFQTMAAYEKDIRRNPAARTTELLRDVFGG